MKKSRRDVTDAMKGQFDSDFRNEMKETTNFILEKKGLELYLVKYRGFCWGRGVLITYYILYCKEYSYVVKRI